jgi:hypothetical protein
VLGAHSWLMNRILDQNGYIHALQIRLPRPCTPTMMNRFRYLSSGYRTRWPADDAG